MMIQHRDLNKILSLSFIHRLYVYLLVLRYIQSLIMKLEATELAKQSASPLWGEDKGEGDSSIPIPLFFKEGLGEISYTYDKNGNMTKKVEFDDDGNIKRTTLYTYDYENRLVKVEIQKGSDVILSGAKNLKVVTFTYDPFGRRLSKSVSHLSLRAEGEAISEEDDNDEGDNDKDDDDKESPRTTYYVYDNEDIVMEYNHKGKVTARYVHGLGIDEPLAIERLAPERLNCRVSAKFPR